MEIKEAYLLNPVRFRVSSFTGSHHIASSSRSLFHCSKLTMLQCRTHSECTNVAIEQETMYSLTGSFYNHDDKDECLLSSSKFSMDIRFSC